MEKVKKTFKPSPMNLINLKPPKKGDLPQTENNTHNEIRHYSTNNPFSSGSHPLKYEEMKALYNINSDLAVFKSIDNSEFLDDAYSTSQTETSSETEETSLPEPLTSLYDPSSINMSQEQLTEHCKKLYRVYKHTYSQKDFQNLLEKTKLQSLNPLWMIHRAGRITASIAGEVSKTNLTEITSESLFKKIMQYEAGVQNKYTRYGNLMEPVARSNYYESQHNIHENFKVDETGFLVSKDFPFLGASPDGMVSCSCHKPRLLEIKCPYKYKNGLVNWQNDKNFPVSSDNKIKTEHQYHYQMQHQMFVFDVDSVDFYIYSESKNAEAKSLLLTIYRDNDFIQTFVSKLKLYFENILLSEIITRRSDMSIENTRKHYCLCKRPSFGNMIACDNPTCKIEWYHYPCVGITRAPKRKWYCNTCSEQKKIKK